MIILDKMLTDVFQISDGSINLADLAEICKGESNFSASAEEDHTKANSGEPVKIAN